MRFEHFIPCDQLKPFISSFVIQETVVENIYRVLPCTSIVIGFQFKGLLSIIEENREARLSAAGVTGLSDRHRTFKSSSDIGTVLVYFKENGASHFFRQPLHELFRESISLENLLPRSELLVLEDQLYEAKTDQQRILVVENFLITQLKPTQSDKLVSAALALIHNSKGNIKISELAKNLNTSLGPLEKRFRQSVGTTAKGFASIIRMKHIINNLKGPQSVPDLAYQAGFYDQSHFIREFKSFSGETPLSFLKSSQI